MLQKLEVKGRVTSFKCHVLVKNLRGRVRVYLYVKNSPVAGQKKSHLFKLTRILIIQSLCVHTGVCVFRPLLYRINQPLLAVTKGQLAAQCSPEQVTRGAE